MSSGRADQIDHNPETMSTRVGLSTTQLIWLILGLGLLLRLWGAWRANLTYDEAAHLVYAQQISFRSDRFNLIFRSDNHPLLNAYTIKLSSMLFGFSFFGLRIVHVLIGTATIWVVYALGRRVYSESAGLWAAALVATDQFHASWSRTFLQETPMLFWFGLTLLAFINVMERRRTRDYVLLGISMALTYLAKETGILLIAAMWIFLFVTPADRSILRDRRWYLAYLIALVIVLPDLVYNVQYFSDSYL
ncbi:MAG: glycosyltransferase family 39 protein, partial [Vicinamibacterales bacterium]